MTLKDPIKTTRYRIATEDGVFSSGGSMPFSRHHPDGIKSNGKPRVFSAKNLHSHLTYIKDTGMTGMSKYYDNDCFIVEYEVVETLKRIVPVFEYLAARKEEELAKTAKQRLKKAEVERRRQEYDKRQAEEARRRQYQILKKEFGE